MQKQSCLIYRGPSEIDGQPIIAALTFSKRNKKLGKMASLYIINDNGKGPIENNRLGLDVSICGNCPLKGIAHNGDKGTAKERVCYVSLIHGPNSIYKAYKANKYKLVNDLVSLGANEAIRLGAYGDPAAVPNHIIKALISKAKSYTGYTHQHDLKSVDYSNCMASTNSLESARKFWKLNIRTFRTIKENDGLQPNEILCPATDPKLKEKAITCATCKLCKGSSIKAKSVAVVLHGNGAKWAA